MPTIGVTELILIILVILLVFEAKRIPEIAKALGRAMHEFKKSKYYLTKESKDLMDAAEKHAEAEDKTKKSEEEKEK